MGCSPGFEAKAEYNLGEINFDLPFTSLLEASVANKELNFDFTSNTDATISLVAPYLAASLDWILDTNLGSLYGFLKEPSELILDKEWQLSDPLQGQIKHTILDLNSRDGRLVVGIPFFKTFAFLSKKSTDVEAENKEKQVIENYQNEFAQNNLEFKYSSDGKASIDLLNGLISLGMEFPSFPDLKKVGNEYAWELTQSNTLLDAKFGVDKLLSYAPYPWNLISNSKDFSFNGSYTSFEWRTLPIDLGYKLDFNYGFKAGLRELTPEIVGGEFLASKTQFNEIDDLLVKDVNNNSKIDLDLRMNLELFFSAHAYLEHILYVELGLGKVDIKGRVNLDGVYSGGFGVELQLLKPDALEEPFAKTEIFNNDLASFKFNDIYRLFTGQDLIPSQSVSIPFNSIFPNVETAGNDVLFLPESAGVENLYGEAGNDLLFGNSSANRIMGGSGSDTIYAGAGNDTIYGDLRHIYADLAYSQQYGGADVIYGGDGNDVVFAGGGNDVVDGDAGNDTIYGEFGNDLLYGGTGDDYIAGGNSDDELYGELGNDSLSRSQTLFTALSLALTLNPSPKLGEGL